MNKSKTARIWLVLILAFLAGLPLAYLVRAADGDSESPPASDPAVDRARREVRMLDDLYKTAVVFINDNYVEGTDALAAGEAARELFAAMKAKGWHDARLIDATGEPLNSENAPADEFETTAIAKIKGGEAYYDQIVEDQGKRYLRAATIVPVVNQKCASCHPGNEVGDTLGAIGYKLEIQ